ncbi:MAG: translation initiation factor IF-3 [Candidatus Pacebacteria bacterium]|nr:translation initiation factor IF-3 [Candidatus Paceibacterota bacterium]
MRLTKILKKYNINNQIRANEVRVIDENGGNLGIMSLAEALNLAQSKNLDVVEIVKTANPPVVKICDYGKFLYQQEKTEKKQKAKERGDEMKQIRLTFNIGKHDMEVRAKQTEEFLKQGLKVQIEIVLRGREKSHKDLATEKLKNFLNSIQHPYKIIQDIKSSPRGLTIVIG